MRHTKFLRVIAFFSIIFATTSVCAQVQGEAWIASLGGKLYDNHWLVNGTSAPAARNPDYPKEIDASDGNTWRCVSCHGWDYRGKDGHLGEVSSSPMFANLRDAVGKDPAKIIEAMMTPKHSAYLNGLAKDQLEALAYFLSSGQIDASKLIQAGKSTGNPKAGKDIFEGVCVSCHQADGKAYIEGESGDEPSLGWVANNRPAQAVHKIANGVPNADMLSLRILPENRLADLLAYLQSLDTSDP